MQGVFELHLTIPLDGQGHVSCERAAVHGAPGNVRTPPPGESVHRDVYGESYLFFFLSSLLLCLFRLPQVPHAGLVTKVDFF